MRAPWSIEVPGEQLYGTRLRATRTVRRARGRRWCAPRPMSERTASQPDSTRSEKRRRQDLWRAFLSSTSQDLEPYRAAAVDVVKSLPLFEPVHMESFGTRDWPPAAYCRAEVVESDVLVVLVGHRYGSSPQDDERSYTEIEYDAAREIELSRLVFIVDDARAGGGELPPEPAARVERLARFRRRVMDDRICGFVTSREELEAKLEVALARWEQEDSVHRLLVDRRSKFREIRARTLAGETAIVSGMSGAGKSEVVSALLEWDPAVSARFPRILSPVLVETAGGSFDVIAALKSCLAQLRGRGRTAASKPATAGELHRAILTCIGDGRALVAYDFHEDLLESLSRSELTAAIRQLFIDSPRVTYVVETRWPRIASLIQEELELPEQARVEVGGLDDEADGLALLARHAHRVAECGELAHRLVRAVHRLPLALVVCGRMVETDSRGSRTEIERQLEHLVNEVDAMSDDENKLTRVIRGRLAALRPDVRDLLGKISILSPKPTPFHPALAFALVREGRSAAAVKPALAIFNDPEHPPRAPTRAAYENVRATLDELFDRGLLERSGENEYTLHPVIAGTAHHDLTTAGQRRNLHRRAERFYRGLISAQVERSYSSWLRFENTEWRRYVSEWVYHLAHVEPATARQSFVATYLDAFWWWGLYIDFPFCEELLEMAGRLRAVSEAWHGDQRFLIELGRFADAYPKLYALARASLGIPLDTEGRDTGTALHERAEVVDSALCKLCKLLGLEREPVLPSAEVLRRPGTGHLQATIDLFFADSQRLRHTATDGDPSALHRALAYYAVALELFLDDGDLWDVAWTHYEAADTLCALEDHSAVDRECRAAWDITVSKELDFKQLDFELLANVERVLGDDLWNQHRPADAIEHYGRAAYYAYVFLIWPHHPDEYTQTFYKETGLRCAARIREAGFPDGAERTGGPATPDLRLALTRVWGDAWEPDIHAATAGLEAESLETSLEAIAAALLPPGPGAQELGKPDSNFVREATARIVIVQASASVVAVPRLV